MPLSRTEAHLVNTCAGRLPTIADDEWAATLALAERHDVDPLVSWQIQHASAPLVSDVPTRTWLLNAAHEAVARSIIRQGLEATETVAVFGALRHIPALLFKGASVANRWYPPGGRLDRDIDIHVPRSAYEQAREALAQLGYAIVPGEDERMQLLQTKDVGFARIDEDGLPWCVEVHVRFTEPGAPDLDVDSVWRDSVTIDIASEIVRVPSPEHTLLLLALNLRKHRFARLKTVIDIARLVEAERHRLDWERLQGNASAAGYAGLLRYAIRLSADILGIPWAGCEFGSRRRYSVTAPCRLLPRVASMDTVFGEQRDNDDSKQVSGLIPFLSLDKSPAALHLIHTRLDMAPEMANYYRSQGVPGSGGYRSRFDYLRDISIRLFRALTVISRNRSARARRVRAAQ
jgi:hypothetical protein